MCQCSYKLTRFYTYKKYFTNYKKKTRHWDRRSFEACAHTFKQKKIKQIIMVHTTTHKKAIFTNLRSIIIFSYQENFTFEWPFIPIYQPPRENGLFSIRYHSHRLPNRLMATTFSDIFVNLHSPILLHVSVHRIVRPRRLTILNT